MAEAGWMILSWVKIEVSISKLYNPRGQDLMTMLTGVFEVLCDHKMPLRMKDKFYKTVVQLAIMYGPKCWVIKKQHFWTWLK